VRELSSREDKIRDIMSHLTSLDWGVPIVWSDEQDEVFWRSLDERVTILAGGEGSAKSTLAAAFAFVLSIVDYRNPLIWIVGADFEDARREANLFIHFADEMGILDRGHSSISSHEDQQVVVKTTLGTTMKTISGYDPLKIGREEPDIILGCEVSRWLLEIWERIYGRLARKAGQTPPSKAFLSGSFETGIGPFFEYWTLGQADNELDVKSFSLPSWANPVAFPGGMNNPAILQLQASMPAERFLARHVGRPAPPRDAVFPEFKMRLHIQDVQINPAFPVHIFIDPATHVYAVEFVQFVYDEVHVIDEVYLADPSHEQVIVAAMTKPSWRQVRDGVMDIASKQNHAGMGDPLRAWMRDTGLPLHTQYCKLDQTIERLRSVLQINAVSQRPRLRISPKCKGLISELGGGPSPIEYGGMWRNKQGRPDVKCNDACKALGYGLIKHFGTARPLEAPDDEEDDGNFVASYMGRPDRDSRLRELMRGV
jgi:hypothetical protein